MQYRVIDEVEVDFGSIRQFAALPIWRHEYQGLNRIGGASSWYEVDD
jgi:hypothetical protein